METKNSTAGREMVIKRLLNAPRELVFKVWTDPKHVCQWWGPNGFTTTVHEMNTKPGGVCKMTMHGPDEMNFPNKITYKEVIKPSLITYTHGTDDEIRPDDFEVTIQFEEQGNKTMLTMRALFKTKEILDDLVEKYHVIEGGNQTINRLAEYLDTQLVAGK